MISVQNSSRTSVEYFSKIKLRLEGDIFISVSAFLHLLTLALYLLFTSTPTYAF